MQRSVFRVPVIGLGFFLMAGVLPPVAGRTSLPSSVASGPAASFSPSPVTVSQTFNGWAFPCIYAVHDTANGPALCVLKQDLSAWSHSETGHLLINKSSGSTVMINFALVRSGGALPMIDAAAARKAPA